MTSKKSQDTGNKEDEEWLSNHLSLGKDGVLSNPLNPVPQVLKNVEGIDKLKRSLAKELSSSTSVRDKSSNLPHLFSMVKCIWPMGDHHQENRYNEILPKCPSAVLKPFNFSEGKTGRLLIDIVSGDGMKWYKVSARNPKSLALVAAGGGGYGKKSIVDHALEYQKCAEENPCLFKPPKIAIIFTSGVSEQVASELESLDVEVIGRRIEDEVLESHPRIKVLQEEETKALQTKTEREQPSSSSSPPSSSLTLASSSILQNPSLDGVDKLNLDISTLLAYLSNVTNGHAHIDFKSKVLADQTEAERERPQKPILDSIFEGRKLFCCETAIRDFQSILSTVGGSEEKARAAQFLSERVTVIPDRVSEKAKSLIVSGNIKERSVIIFSSGEAIEAVTVTANSGFVRSARSQGVEFPSFIHEPRALTEQKEYSPDHIYGTVPSGQLWNGQLSSKNSQSDIT